MKKSVFDLIRYANHVLFLGLLLVLFGSLIMKQINSYQRQKQNEQRYEQMRNAPGLPIENGATASESSESQQLKAIDEPPDYRLELLQQVEDVYVFQIINDQIDTRVEHQNTPPRQSDSLRRGYTLNFADVERQHMVNLMFSRESQPSRMLLPQDALIYDVKLKRNIERYHKQSLNIYMIMTDDSNGDDRLGLGDRIDLYSSEYDGSKLRLAMQDIESYKLIDDDRLLVTRQQDQQQIFYLLDLLSNEHSLLDTSLQTTLRQNNPASKPEPSDPSM